MASALIKENNLPISSPEDFDRLFPDQIRPNITYAEFLSEMPVLKNTNEFIEKIVNFDKKDPICICGDYDSDGIMATVIMLYTFSELGYNIHFDIPNRLTDGYGISLNKIEDDIKKYGTKLFITVDTGITSRNELDKIKENYDVDFVITDHHLPDNEQVPNTLIIDPKYNLDEFSDICGAHVALKLCYALISSMAPDRLGIIETLIPLAGIATVADMMPVLEENRQLIRLTLDAINAAKYSGGSYLFKIIQSLGGSNFIKNPTAIATEELISFSIAPAINAVSRVNGDVSDLVKKLLECLKRPWVYMPSYINWNIIRQRMTSELWKKFNNDFDKNSTAHSVVYLYNNEDYKNNIKGILGLIANKISNKYKIVSLAGSMKDDKIVEFSGCSVPNYSLHDGIMRIKEAHPEFELGGGGHSQAMGIHLLYEKLDDFKIALEEDIIANSPPYDPVIFEYEPEMENEIMSTIEELQPYGQGFKCLKFKYTGIFLSYDYENKIAIISDYKFKMFISQDEIDDLIGTDIDVIFTISYSSSEGPIFSVMKE